ncbi:hypothetical protein CVS28_18190 [Arthrobacter glacialis]|nr:hypothetical protein CVS28_18190 [Arthrobacter glacialis]
MLAKSILCDLSWPLPGPSASHNAQRQHPGVRMTQVHFGYAPTGVLALRHCHSCASQAAGNAHRQSQHELLPPAIHASSILFMSAAHEDLTARARLRDAAIECFAAQGFEESLRAIAARAGVSAGLVRHHFGSKEQLRAECDATVLKRYSTLKSESIKTDPQQLFAQFPASREGGILLVYILRSVREGGAAAASSLNT